MFDGVGARQGWRPARGGKPCADREFGTPTGSIVRCFPLPRQFGFNHAGQLSWIGDAVSSVPNDRQCRAPGVIAFRVNVQSFADCIEYLAHRLQIEFFEDGTAN